MARNPMNSKGFGGFWPPKWNPFWVHFWAPNFREFPGTGTLNNFFLPHRTDGTRSPSSPSLPDQWNLPIAGKSTRDTGPHEGTKVRKAWFLGTHPHPSQQQARDSRVLSPEIDLKCKSVDPLTR